MIPPNRREDYRMPAPPRLAPDQRRWFVAGGILRRTDPTVRHATRPTGTHEPALSGRGLYRFVSGTRVLQHDNCSSISRFFFRTFLPSHALGDAAAHSISMSQCMEQNRNIQAGDWRGVVIYASLDDRGVSQDYITLILFLILSLSKDELVEG